MMTKEDVTAAAKEGVKEALGELYIPREQHYLDHKFTLGVRDGIATGRKGGIWTLAAAIVGGLIWAVKAGLAHLGQGVAP